MLACQEYSKAIDMWSVGCIFAELLARKPLFPGEDYIAQLRLICEKLGRPSDETLNFVTSERAKKFMISLPKKAPVPMADLFPAHTEEHEALDLLSKMLSFDPSSRISIDAALEHPFLTSLHNADDEPVADFTFSFDFENEELSREKVRELIWDELRTYHPSIAESPPSSATPRRRASQMLADNKANGKSDAKSDVDDKKVSANSTSETDDDREEKESDLSSSKKRHIPPIAPKK
jgi:mitogen-activated protein kinase 1/3